MRKFFKFLKRFMPQTFYARSLLIIMLPMLLTLGIVMVVFLDRHLGTVNRRMANSIAGEIGMIANQFQIMGEGEEWDNFRARIAKHMNMIVSIEQSVPFPQNTQHTIWSDPVPEALAAEINNIVRLPFYVDPNVNEGWILVMVKLPDNHMLVVQVGNKRLYTSTTLIFVYWLVGAGVFFFVISAIFMRNQVRPIKKLALAAEQFGKGMDVERFRPKGAAEIRRASAAFIVMRERIKKQISQRTSMLSGVSHDLRTPLTRMKLQCAMMEDNDDVRAIKEDIVAMEQMIDGYLAFARGEGEEEMEDTSLNTVLHSLVSSSRRQGKEILFDAVNPDITIKVRPHAIKRCITNLLSNAMKYAEKAWVSIKTLPAAVEIIIEDNGPGIPKDKREDAFKPFYRLEESRNTETGGVGLGLSIARDIARAHGGTIRLETSQYGGLRAVVQIPL